MQGSLRSCVHNSYPLSLHRRARCGQSSFTASLPLRASKIFSRSVRWRNCIHNGRHFIATPCAPRETAKKKTPHGAACSMIKLSITKYYYFLFIQYIYFMEPQYKTLQTIFNITREDSQPTTYKCRPREIILRQFQDWSEIQQHLHLLETEGLINTRQEETLVIQITHQGIAKIISSNLLVTGD